MSSLALTRSMFSGSSVGWWASHSQPQDRWESASNDALIVFRFSLFLKLPFYRLLIAHKLKIVSGISSLSSSLFFPTLLRSSFSLARLFHLFFFSQIFHSVWLSFCHFLSPVSWLLTVSLSLPLFLPLLSFDYCLTFTLSLFHSALPPSPVSFSLSFSLPPLSLPPLPLLLISPSVSLYL